MSQPNIFCSICNEPLDTEYLSILPGTSDEGYRVKPCCNTEEITDTLEYIKDTIADELREANDRLQGTLEEYTLAVGEDDDPVILAKILREIKDWQTSLTSSIDELHKQFEEME